MPKLRTTIVLIGAVKTLRMAGALEMARYTLAAPAPQLVRPNGHQGGDGVSHNE
jgi:hypothetical protein